MGAEPGVIIENVVGISWQPTGLPGGPFRLRDRMPAFYQCDLRLADDKLSAPVRPESRTQSLPEHLRSPLVPFAQVRKISAKKAEILSETQVKRLLEEQPATAAKVGDPLSYEVNIESGGRLWSHEILHFRLTAAQFAIFREFMQKKLTLPGQVFEIEA